MNKKKENVILEKLAQSIEDLAQMTAAGFLDHGNRISSLENRFDKFEGRFDVLEGRFDVLENRFDGLEDRFDILEDRFDTIEEKVDTLISGQSRMLDILLNHTASRAEVRELDHRVVRLEQHLKMA